MATEEEFGEREFYRRLNRAISAGTVREKHIYPELKSVFKGKITVGDYSPTNAPASASVPHRVIHQGETTLVKTCYFQARCTCWDDVYIEPDDQVLSAPIIKGEA